MKPWFKAYVIIGLFLFFSGEKPGKQDIEEKVSIWPPFNLTAVKKKHLYFFSPVVGEFWGVKSNVFHTSQKGFYSFMYSNNHTAVSILHLKEQKECDKDLHSHLTLQGPVHKH